MIIFRQTPNLLIQAWSINKPLATLVILCCGTLLFSFFGLFIDPRVTEILNTPVWTKTFKFSLSLAVYGASLLWAITLIDKRFYRGVGIAASIIGSTLILEIGLIITQAIRAQPMHFNETTPFNTLLWQMMSIGINIMLLAYIALMVMAWRGLKTNPVLMWGIRLGFVVTLLSFFQGSLMPPPNPVQQGALNAGQTLGMIGAHTVGSSSLTPDNGTGLPLLGWSTTHGDLRIGHFIGIHALQLLPFLALWLLRRREGWLSDKHSVALISIAAFAYTGLMLLVTWQALRGQSIIAPDFLTMSVFFFVCWI